MSAPTTTTTHRTCGGCGYTMSTYPNDESPRYHQGRGLCNFCRSGVLKRGTLADHERRTRTRDEVMAEWELLRDEGLSKAQAAERLGMAFKTFETAYTRARRAGDLRALPAHGGSRRWWATDGAALQEMSA